MNQNSTEMSEWKRDWTEKQKDLYHRALAVGHHLRRNIRDRYYILYDQCPDKQGVSAIVSQLHVCCVQTQKYLSV